jgi:outer membrane protein OmpA-like peptidoglycan-associated protein
MRLPVVFRARKFSYIFMALACACSKPLAVSHLSPEGIALTQKKGYGRPTHNYFSRFICFDEKCRKKAAWVKRQKKDRFKGYKNSHGLPSYRDRRTILNDTSMLAGLPVPAQPSPNEMVAPMRKDSVITLNAILFEKDHYQLKQAVYPRLDSVVNFLKQKSSVTIRVLGYTDNEGSEQHNLRLSEKRAEAVATYFIDNGISDERIEFKGFGSAKPVAENTTLSGRQKNRRVEIILHDSQ